MRRIIFMSAPFLLALCWGAVGRAGIAEWRDGCPAGNVQQTPDIVFADPAAAPPYSGTDPRLMGPAPQLDSALVPTRVLLAPAYLHFAGDDEAPRARLLGGLAQVKVNAGESHSTNPWVGGLSLTAPYLAVLSGDLAPDGQPAPAPDQAGNLVLALSLQHYWLTSILDDPDTDAKVYIAGLRNAWALQLTGAARPWSHDAEDSAILLQRTAFDAALFTPHKAVGGSFEWRTEGVGCYAPFIDVRLSLLLTRDASEQHWSLFAPQTLAVGFAGSSSATAMVQYGMLFSAYSGPAAKAVLPTNVVHRVRFGLDVAFASEFSIGVAFDVFLNSSLYDGTAFEGHLAWNFGDGRFL
jgi:hypothetical protein